MKWEPSGRGADPGAVGGDGRVDPRAGQVPAGRRGNLIGKKAGDKVTVPVDFPESRQYREEQPQRCEGWLDVA